MKKGPVGARASWEGCVFSFKSVIFEITWEAAKFAEVLAPASETEFSNLG